MHDPCDVSACDVKLVDSWQEGLVSFCHGRRVEGFEEGCCGRGSGVYVFRECDGVYFPDESVEHFGRLWRAEGVAFVDDVDCVEHVIDELWSHVDDFAGADEGDSAAVVRSGEEECGDDCHDVFWVWVWRKAHAFEHVVKEWLYV